jgi:hypothetical protein
MNERIEKIEKEILEIKKRNERVELEKAWETSFTRHIALIVITYLLIVVVMYFLDIQKPFINAIIPTTGYFLSTQSLPFIKKCWINKKRK